MDINFKYYWPEKEHVGIGAFENEWSSGTIVSHYSRGLFLSSLEASTLELPLTHAVTFIINKYHHK